MALLNLHHNMDVTTKLVVGATGKRKVRKTVAPDGAKPVDGATEKGNVRRPVVPMEKTSRHNYGK